MNRSTKPLWRGGLALLVASIAACGDGVSPELRGATVRISLSGAAYDEQTIEVGDVIQLSAEVLDLGGDRVPGEVIEWSSTEPDVAKVDAGGAVVGVSVGTAYIVAEHRVGADSARVNVASRVTGPVACGTTELDLALGETRTLEGGESASICLPGTGAGSEYSLVLVNASSAAGSRLQTRVQAAGVDSIGGGPRPALLPPATKPDFHHAMRHDVSARLVGRLRAGIDVGAIDVPRSQVALDEVVSFNVETTSSNGCANPDVRGGRVRAISQYAIVVADTLNPAGGFGPADYAAFAKFFDDEAWPLITGTFGQPSDIDRNGKIYVFFTRAVNERPENSPASQGIYVGGFFFNRDLFPTTGAGACEGSNVTEMFYMLVPDPEGEVSGRRFSKDFVDGSTRSVLVHEFQHLVNDSRRLHVNDAADWEETWLNEGLSHIAEELMFYRASGLGPERNLGPNDFASAATRDAFDLYQLSNLERLASYLRAPETNSLMGSDVLATRGAAWHFLRYAADRHPNEAAFWRELVTEGESAGLENLQQAIGADPKDWIRDWSAAIYLDDTELAGEDRYRVASWNLRELYPAVPGLWPPLYYTRYPLRVTRLSDRSDDENVSLMGGGAAYFRAGVASGEHAALRVTVGELPAPSRLKVVVTRVK